MLDVPIYASTCFYVVWLVLGSFMTFLDDHDDCSELAQDALRGIIISQYVWIAVEVAIWCCWLRWWKKGELSSLPQL
jgi:hypothetical protein